MRKLLAFGDLHLRTVDIRADTERHRESQRAIHGGCRGHVEHIFDADDRLFERRGHGIGDDFRVRARVGRMHDDLRRYDLRILADRQFEQRDQAGDRDERRDDAREDRSFDEEVREVHVGP